MTNVTLILAMILFSICVTSKVTVTENWLFRAPRIVTPTLDPAAHFLPDPFHPTPEVIKCMSGKDEIENHERLKTQHIGSECYAMIKKMKEDCKITVYGSYHKPFWAGYFKLHCSTVVGSTSPAPSPAEGF